MVKKILFLITTFLYRLKLRLITVKTTKQLIEVLEKNKWIYLVGAPAIRGNDLMDQKGKKIFNYIYKIIT